MTPELSSNGKAVRNYRLEVKCGENGSKSKLVVAMDHAFLSFLSFLTKLILPNAVFL